MKNGLKSLPIIGALGAIAVAIMGLLGYLPGMGLLGSIRENYIPMAPSTAISFIFLGFIQLVLKVKQLSGAKTIIPLIVTLLVSLFGILEVAGYFIGIDLNFEDTLVPTAGILNGIPIARMSPATGAAFFLSGVAVFFLIFQRKFSERNTLIEYFGSGLGILVLLISFVFCLAYLYETPLLYGLDTTIPMAQTTGLGFIFLSISILTSERDSFPLRLLAGTSTRSYLLRFILPLSTLSVILGGVTVLSSEQASKMNPAFITAALTVLIAIITGFVATLVSRHIDNKIDRSEAALYEQTQKLAALNKLGQMISTSLSSELVAQTAVNQILDVFAPDIVMIFLRQGQELILKRAGPNNSQYLHEKTPVHCVGECLCGLAASDGKPIYSKDIDNDPRCIWAECKEASLHSVGAIPFIIGDRVIGVMGIGSASKRDFKKDSDFLEIFSSQITIALQNAQLYEQAQNQTAQLEQELKERLQAEEALRESEGRLKDAQRIGSVGHWEFDVESQKIYWSDQVYRLFERDPTQGPPTFEENLAYYYAKDSKKIQEQVRRAVEFGENFDTDYQLKLPSGKPVYQQSIIKTKKDDTGRVIKVYCIVQDVTERKRTEEKLQETHKKLTTSIDNMPNAYILCDTEALVLEWNGAAEKIFGYSKEEMLGKNLIDFIVPEKVRHLVGESVKKLKIGEVADYSEKDNNIRKDGKLISCQWFNTPLADDNGKVFGILFMGQDITERKKTEEALREAHDELERRVEERTVELVKTNEQLHREIEERKKAEEELRKTKEAAEAANRAKSDFLASMSHELRTPLNSIIGFSEVLRDRYFGSLTKKQEEYVNDIFGSGKHLLALINDILDLSKVDAGKFELELGDVHIAQLLEHSLVMIKEKAHRHGISLDLNISKEVSDLVFSADERKLKQVIFNLLSNAAKFTPDGGSITLEARREGEEVVVSVSDTGIGIAPGEQEKIFDEFYQARAGIVDKTPGTGLGLPISKSLVEMHSGRMRVESDGEGKGSRFSFALPLKTGSTEAGEP